jgi:hypothetical protein
MRLGDDGSNILKNGSQIYVPEQWKGNNLPNG